MTPPAVKEIRVIRKGERKLVKRIRRAQRFDGRSQRRATNMT